MGPIQSGINQSLAILSLASSQSPQAQTQRKATADTKAFDKFVKTEENTPIALGEKSEEMFKGLQEQAIKSNLEAGRTKDLVNIKDTKSQYGQAIESIKRKEEEYNQVKNFLTHLKNSISTKTRIKANMDMMKSDLKEDN